MSFGTSIVTLLKDDLTLFGVVEGRIYEYPEKIGRASCRERV